MAVRGNDNVYTSNDRLQTKAILELHALGLFGKASPLLVDLIRTVNLLPVPKVTASVLSVAGSAHIRDSRL